LSLFNELKRRSVLRVAIAYLAASWLLIQIVETLFPIFGLSDTLIRLIVIFLAIGLPLALIFSWLYELTPEGLKLEEDIDRSRSLTHHTGKKLDRAIIVILSLALAYFGFDKFLLSPQREAALVKSATQAGALMEREKPSAIPEKSIAVLPFVNMSEDAGNEFFADGLSEELLNLLVKIPELRVVARTSSFSFKGKDVKISDIAHELNVGHILEGSVRKSGDKVRIAAQLIDVSNGTQIWSKSYDRTMTDIFEIQDEVAAAIIEAMQIHVGIAPTRGRPTESTEAYILFLKARTLLNTHLGRAASNLLQQAIVLDPNFAEAHELQALSYWTQAGVDRSVEEGIALMGQAATSALAIEPNLAIPQALSNLAMGGGHARVRALGHLKRAWRESTTNSVKLRVLIYELEFAGYLQEAMEYAQQYVYHDPLSPMANYSLGETQYAVGRIKEAQAPLNFAYDLGEGFAQWFVPAMHLIEGNNEMFITQTEANLVSQGFNNTGWVRELVEGARDPNKGQAYMDRRSEEILASFPDESTDYWRGFLEDMYLFLGFLDGYYEIIFSYGPNEQVQTMADVHVWVGSVFRGTGFTSHPRYLEVAELLGITDIWEQLGPPDFCEKVDTQWVCV